MNLSAIQSRLANLFSAREDPSCGRVVIWFDPEGEFADVVDQLDLPGVQIEIEEPNRLFELKCRLNARPVDQDVLLYRQRYRGDLQDNWFADVEFYATPFQADMVSMLMADLGVADVPALRSAVSSLRGFLRKKANVKRVRSLVPAPQRPQELYLAVMAVALGAPEATWTSVIIAYLMGCHDDGRASVLERLEGAGVWEQFSAMVANQTGYQDDARNTAELQKHILLTALVGNGHLSKALAGLERCMSVNHARNCLTLVHTWMRSEVAGAVDCLYEICREVEDACGLVRRLSLVPIDSLLQSDVFPCINECILRDCMRGAESGCTTPEEALCACAQRKNLKWYKRVAPYFEGVAAQARMAQFAASYSSGFHEETAAKFWEGYTDRGHGWWRMDAEYRRFRQAVAQATERPVFELDDEFKALAQVVERLYRGWFLDELGNGWCAAIADNLATQGYIDGVDRQAHFFMNRVAGLAKGKAPAFVVVSDALRYEVACELAERLEQETKGSVELESMQAMFPSETPYGMAALLPHGAYAVELDADSKPSVQCDGMPTSGCAARQRVLDARYPGSVAVQYHDYMAMQRSERKQLVANAPVVYVYHDRIDATGEKHATEHDVFGACERAVSELTSLVGLIAREGASTVLVTADHGFLYTAEPLPETAKVGIEEVCGEVLAVDRRSVLARKGATSDVLMGVGMAANGSSNLVGFTPRGAVRVRRSGPVQNYMHGGVSLQELCVPVLTFKNLKTNSKGYVETTPVQMELVSNLTTVTNNIFSLDFFQKEPVGGKNVAALYEAYIAEGPDASAAAVSDVVKLVADKTSDVREERMVRVAMAIRGDVQTSAQKDYYLVLVAVENKMHTVAWSRPVRIDIAFAVEDFGW